MLPLDAIETLKRRDGGGVTVTYQCTCGHRGEWSGSNR